MPTLNELYQAKTAAHGKAQAIAERAKQEGRNLTHEETATIDGYFSEIDSIDQQINTETRNAKLAQIAAGMSAPTGRQSAPQERFLSTRLQAGESNRILRGWASWGFDAPDLSLVNRAVELGVSLSGGSFSARALTAGTSGAGAELVPQNYLPELERELTAFCPFMEFCKILDTDTGNDIPYPKLLDSVALMPIAEGANATQADPVTSAVTLKAWEMRTLQPFSIALLTDSGYNFESELQAILGERFGRGLDNLFISGNGTSQPQGLKTYVLSANSSQTVRTGGINSVTSIDLLNLQHAVDRAYRQEGIYVLQDSTFKRLRSEVDTTGRLIWQPGTAAGAPNTLHGNSYVVTDYLDEMGTVNRTLALFFHPKRYVIRRVRKIDFQKLVELYAAQGMVGINAVWRVDARWVGTEKAIACLRTPAA